MVEQKSSWDFSQEEEDFSRLDELVGRDIETWEFFEATQDEEGKSGNLQARCDPKLARAIDEIVFIAKNKGLPFKTRSDYVRWSARRVLAEVISFVGEESSEAAKFVLFSSQMMKRAENQMQLMQISKTVDNFVLGLRYLINDQYEEIEEATIRVSGFLEDIMDLPSSQAFIKRMYTRQLIARPGFVNVTKTLIERGVESEVLLSFAEYVRDSFNLELREKKEDG